MTGMVTFFIFVKIMEQDYNLEQEQPNKKKSHKLLWLMLLLIPVILIVACYGYNYYSLQVPLDNVISNDSRNSGIEVTVKYDSYINFKTIVFDLKEFTGKAPVDLFRVFLQYADAMQKEKFDYVLMSYRGNRKFKIPGSYFKQLGSEYSSQNAVYTMRTFPENLLNLDGSKAYGEWTGGLLGVLKQQMEDFNDFIRKWTETN